MSQQQQKKKVPPREVHSRDEQYMGEAWIKAAKSKDPKTQVGAVIVGADNVPLGGGYNGPNRMVQDQEMDWDRPQKYHLIRHAEKNAIKYSLRVGGTLKGATLYCTDLPCPACMNDIAAEEVARVVYFPKRKNGGWNYTSEDEEHTREIAKFHRIVLEEFKGNLNWMRDRIHFMESMGVFD